MLILFILTDILTDKGVYAYDYMNSWDKFNEMPSKEHFYSKLYDEAAALRTPARRGRLPGRASTLRRDCLFVIYIYIYIYIYICV